MKRSLFLAALSTIASSITNPCARAADDPLILDAKVAKAETPSYVSLWTGAKLENPYSISIDTSAKTATLQANKSKADGFIQLSYDNSFVLRQGDAKSKDPLIFADESARIDPESTDGQFVKPWIHFPDINTSIGYVFRGSSSPTNFNASTIAGGSDLYVSGGLGFPFWRKLAKDGQSMQSTIEVSGGATTDKDTLLLHPVVFFGGGFQGAYNIRDGTNSPRIGIWSGRIGYARTDHPKITSGSTVAINGLNQPAFDPKWAPSLGFDITFPFSASVSARLGGNMYFTDSPASWNISLGLSLDPTKWIK